MIGAVMQQLVTGVRGTSIKLIVGLMVTIVAIGPLLKGEFNLRLDMEKFSDNRQWLIRDGEAAAQETLSTYIKKRTETYILERTVILGADVSVDVQLSSDAVPTPFAVTVTGGISPYEKQQLSGCIEDELGIDREQQRWIS